MPTPTQYVASPIDRGYYYRPSNRELGSGKSLEIYYDGFYRLKMSNTADSDNQLWRFVPNCAENIYALRIKSKGDGYSLDVLHEGGTNEQLWLVETGYFAGQLWSLTPWGDGTYKLTNHYTGPENSMGTFGDAHELLLRPGDQLGQHWTITKQAKLEAH